MGKYSEIKIAYYSGTGGTAMAAECFMQRLQEEGCACSTEVITDGRLGMQNNHDLLLLLFPVHALNAPEPVYKWIGNLKAVSGTDAAVISVSGGGEVSPNTACRLSSIKRLSDKGYPIVYDTMLVMPSNFAVPTKKPLASMLLQVLPKKVDEAVKDIFSDTSAKSNPLLFDRILARMAELEKPAAKLWGRGIKALAVCNGCGWCAQNCPSKNITMVNGKPKFSGKCHLCLKCIYGCKQRALTPTIGKFFIIKEGYDLKHLSEAPPLGVPASEIEKAAGYLWSGVTKYLLE